MKRNDTRELSQSILSYIDSLENRQYWELILTKYDENQISGCISKLLKSSDLDTIHSASLFTRDLMFNSSTPITGCCSAFRHKYPQSSVVQALQKLVFSKNKDLRHIAVYTLGKTCVKSSLPTLLQAFKSFMNSDPLLLPRLLSEISWLDPKSNAFDTCIKKMALSSLFLTRWAVLGTLTPFQNTGKIFKLKKEIYALLSTDKVSVIRCEASFLLKQLMFEQLSANTKKKSIKQSVREAPDTVEPKFTFEALEIEFNNYRYKNSIQSYRVSDLVSFIRTKNIDGVLMQG